jgi:hypothetical protein
VSCTERRFSYLFGEFSGTVIIIVNVIIIITIIIIIIIININSFALSRCCSLNYYCVEPFVLKWYFWFVKPGLSTCAPFPGSSGGLINKF